MSTRFAGSVLAGGESTRMGSDKAFVEIEGQPLIMRSIGALTEAGASPITVVGGDGARISELGLSAVRDLRPGEGPAQAVLTALEMASDPDLVVVLACDLLDPSAAFITAIVDAMDASPRAAVSVPIVDGRRQWLHACWRRSVARPLLADAVVRGERSMWGSVAGGSVVDVGDVPASAVADADRPEDLRFSDPADR